MGVGRVRREDGRFPDGGRRRLSLWRERTERATGGATRGWGRSGRRGWRTDDRFTTLPGTVLEKP